jgi:hypothetical protein
MISTFLIATLLAPSAMTVKVEGDGYLRFAKGTMTVYARQAKLIISPEGLTSSDGSVLVPRITVPPGASGLSVGLDGTVAAKLGTGPKAVGRIVLAMFPVATKLEPFGNFLRAATKPALTNPGEGLAGVIRVVGNATPVAVSVPQTPQVEAHKFAGAKAEVRVSLKSEVDEEYIRLGSIAEIEAPPQVAQKLKNVELGRAPIYGSSRGLTVTQVRATLLSVGVDLRSIDLVVPAGATVERKCQRVSAETITLQVQEAVKKKLGFETNLELKNRIQTLCVPTGDLVIDVAQVQLNNGQVSAAVDITVNNKIASSLSLTYAVPDIAQVKRGEVVRLRMISNAAKVEVTAKAKSDAYLGQKITVETSTGAVQTGTLIGPNLVEVRL